MRKNNLSHNPRVPTLSVDGNALMPTKASKARRLLEAGKAKVVTNDLGLFTIQLLFRTESEETQDIVIGVDPGSHFTGIAAQSSTQTHCGYNLDLPREKVTKRLEERKMLRRSRRGRRIKRNLSFKLRNHRQVRFNNRKGLEIVPSIRASKQLELRIISEITRLFPVSHVIIEQLNTSKSKGFTRAVQGNNWLIKQLFQTYPNITIGTLKGYETSALRKHLKLSKSLDKYARDASSHVNDAITLASSHFVCYTRNRIEKSADFIGSINLTDFGFKCISRLNSRTRKMHDSRPKKGNTRKTYGGFAKKHNFQNGDYVKYETKKKTLFGYIQSNDIYQFVNNKWKRVKQLKNSRNLCKIKNSSNLVVI
jgi:hypothetical protein